MIVPALEGLAAVPAAVHAEGGLVALQLFHAGRYAFEAAFGVTPSRRRRRAVGMTPCETMARAGTCTIFAMAGQP